MEAIGTPVRSRLVVIYTISACYAGIAGALLAQTTQFVSLDVLSFARSAEVMLVLVLGGAGHLYGGLVGAVLFCVARDVLSDMTPQYWEFWMGIGLVAVALLSRGGVIGLAAGLRGGAASAVPPSSRSP
jgi:branched-chain amino acid transport system permease protein